MVESIIWRNPDRTAVAGSSDVVRPVPDGLLATRPVLQDGAWDKIHEWMADADQYGDFIRGKHKSAVGAFIPWRLIN